MKKLGLTTVVLSALFLSGCGGGGSKKNDVIKDKPFINILTDIKAGICESPEFRNDVVNKVKLRNPMFRETDNTTKCETYGKTNDGNHCIIEYVGSGNKNCVIGSNGAPVNNKMMNLYDVSELLVSEL